MSKTILFFGNERLATGVTTGTPALRGLIDGGYEVAAVVVAQHEAGPSRQARQLEVAALAAEHGIPVLAPEKLDAAKLSAFGAEAAVLAAYGKVVPPQIINLFPKGIINIHPSLLPAYRGSTPIESAILDGAKRTGVSLMKLVPQMDAGPVYSQQVLVLSGQDDKASLARRLSDLGAELLLKDLPSILGGNLEPAAQDEAKATFCHKIDKSDAVLDFNKPAKQLEREVRAYAGWPRSRATLGGIDVTITSAHVGPGNGPAGSIWRQNGHLGIHAAEDVLIIDTLIPAGRKEMAAQAFLAGYKL